MERDPFRDLTLNAPRRARVRGGRSKDDMTPRQGLLAALLALAMMCSMSAGLGVWWYFMVR